MRRRLSHAPGERPSRRRGTQSPGFPGRPDFLAHRKFEEVAWLIVIALPLLIVPVSNLSRLTSEALNAAASFGDEVRAVTVCYPDIEITAPRYPGHRPDTRGRARPAVAAAAAGRGDLRLRFRLS